MSVRGVIWSTVKELTQTALISLTIFFFVYVFLAQPHRVKGDSMLPNFRDGELLLTDKISYRLYKPERGDVVVFRAPTPRKVDFIKRIIGVPGETIRIENGTVFIDDQELAEPYETAKTGGRTTVTLDRDQYFVLGDNRGSSSDSRSFGPIERKKIKGRVWLVYWPIFNAADSEGARKISRVQYSIPDTFNNR